ncbi:S8 family peptidase [Actinokineospora sp. 24-640]
MALAVSGIVAAPAQAATGAVLHSGHPDAVSGSYIVVLKKGTDLSAARTEVVHGTKITFSYEHALSGYAVRTDATNARRIAADPRVAYVAQDLRVRLTDADRPAAPPPTVGAQALGVQINPPSWGLDRLDQRYRPIDARYHYANTGSNVRAYIVGTGIRYTHREFTGSAVAGYDAVGGVVPPGSDCNGHGTHMAGTVGGQTVGVAKDVTLVSVRVLNCQGSGTYSAILAGINWITQDTQASGRRSVVMMSVGSSFNQAFNDAITASTNANVHYSLPSGSAGGDACGSSPGSATAGTTVSASDATDTRASFTNFGPCVDLFAPGVNIYSAWGTSDSAYSTISGVTASAHATGVAALWRHRFPNDSALATAAALTANATPGIVANVPANTANLLLHSGMIPT